jgi:hypothetical protein
MKFNDGGRMNLRTQISPFADPRTVPMKTYGVMAIAAPSDEVSAIHSNMIAMFNDVLTFPISDSYGEFPDTRGYDDKNFAELESTMEDPALFKTMQKCMDAVMDKVDRKYERFCSQYPGRVEKFIHWPKFGGKVFAVVGIVKVYPHAITLVH